MDRLAVSTASRGADPDRSRGLPEGLDGGPPPGLSSGDARRAPRTSFWAAAAHSRSFLSGVLVGAAAALAGLSFGRDAPAHASLAPIVRDPVAVAAADPGREGSALSAMLDAVIAWDAERFGGPVDAETALAFLDAGLSAVDRQGGVVDAETMGALFPGAVFPGAVFPGAAGRAPAGLGLYFDPAGAALTVAGVAPGSPAEAAGLRPGDALLRVAGRPLPGDFAAARDALSRAVSTPGAVRIDVRRRTSSFAVEVKPGPWRSAAAFVSDVFSVEDGAGAVIRFRSMASGAAADLAAAIDQAARFIGAPPKALVLDMSDNGGGVTDEAVRALTLFLGAGAAVFERETRATIETASTAGWGVPTFTGPLAVVVNGRTASSAEIFVAALRGAGRATIVGDRTMGKTSIQHARMLPGLSEGVRYTVGRYRPAGAAVEEGKGLAPDLSAAPAAALAAAIDAVSGVAGRP